MTFTRIVAGVLTAAAIAATPCGAQGAAAKAAARTHVVEMRGGRFAPYEITIEKGDTVRFVLGSGGPHNVAFRETKGAAADRLRKLMADQIGDLSGPLLVVPGESYVIVFTDVPSGRYPYWCVPHLGMGIMGSIVVR